MEIQHTDARREYVNRYCIIDVCSSFPPFVCLLNPIQWTFSARNLSNMAEEGLVWWKLFIFMFPPLHGKQYTLSLASSIAIEKAQMISIGQMQNIFRMLKAVKLFWAVMQYSPFSDFCCYILCLNYIKASSEVRIHYFQRISAASLQDFRTYSKLHTCMWGT